MCTSVRTGIVIFLPVSLNAWHVIWLGNHIINFQRIFSGGQIKPVLFGMAYCSLHFFLILSLSKINGGNLYHGDSFLYFLFKVVPDSPAYVQKCFIF